MPQKCVVPNCCNSYKAGKTLLSFPTNPARRQLWLSALGLTGLTLKPHQRLCEYHFKPSDWHDSVSNRRLLKQSAVPSLVCLNQHCLVDCEVSSPMEGVVVLTPSQQIFHSSSCAISIAEDLKTATPTSSPLLMKKIKICDRLSSENANLRNNVSKLKCEISSKTKDLQKTERRILALNQSANQKEEWLRSKFGDDQLKAAQTGNSKGITWEMDSVQKAVELRLAGGSAGLKAASELVFPLPSVRTIQRRTQSIKFNPGLLHEFLEPFKEKVQTFFSTRDKDCALHFDEMSTKSQRSFDQGTGQYFGEVTLEGVKGLSCKLEVWTFAGIQTKWKINAAYHCTPAEGCYDARSKVILDLLKFSEEAGLNCLALVCDMGNRGVLSTLGFNFTKNERKYAIPHPFNPKKTLYVVPDVVHVFKAVKEMLVSNKIAYLSEDIVNRFALPTNEVSFQHIEWITDFQDDMDVKFVPRLTKKDLSQNHFSKMNTATATHIFNDKCAATLNFLAEEKIFEEECKTTAWFVDLIRKWFTILTSRSLVHALSFKNMDVYKSAIDMLNLVVEVFSTLNVNNVWKPVQTHVIMATEALLDIQHHLIFELGYDFIFMSRFDNDVSENIYSDIRKQRPNPTPLESKYRLKQNTLSQCSRKVLKSQYNHDDRVNLLSLEDILEYQNKKKSVINQPNIVNVNCKPLPWEFPSQTDWKGYKFQHLILYRMCGYLLHSLRVNNQLKCDTCFNNLQHHGDSPLLVAKWVTQTDFAEGAQVQVSAALFDLLQAIDYNLKKWHPQLATAPNAKSLAEESIKPGLAKYEVPTCVACPNLKQTISNKFLVMRMKQLEQSKVATDKPQNEGYQLSSKSMGYRYLAARYTSNKKKGNAVGSKGGKGTKKKPPSTGIKRLKRLT